MELSDSFFAGAKVGKYVLHARIGQGAFGVIWQGFLVDDPEALCAVKVESKGLSPSQLEREAAVYRALGCHTDAPPAGFPRLLWHGEVEGHVVMVTELLGACVEDLFNYTARKFSPQTVLKIAEQALLRIEAVHRAGFVHCDVKPENMLAGFGGMREVPQTIHLIDFGLSKPLPCDPVASVSFQGSVRFGSTQALRNRAQNRADDLESLGFVVVYLLRGGTLPWEMQEQTLFGLHSRGGHHQFFGNAGVNENARARSVDSLLQRKLEMSVPEIVEGLPRDLGLYFETVRGLTRGAEPDYDGLRALLLRVVSCSGTAGSFDWCDAKHVLRRGARGYLPLHLQPLFDVDSRAEGAKMREKVAQMQRQVAKVARERQQAQSQPALSTAPPPMMSSLGTADGAGLADDGIVYGTTYKS